LLGWLVVKYTDFDDDDDETGSSWAVSIRDTGPRPAEPEPVAAQGHVAELSELMANLYVPALPLHTRSGPTLLLQLFERDSGLYALAYSRLDELVNQLGRYQPWALVDAVKIQPILAQGNIEALIVDPPEGAYQLRWARTAINELVEVNDDLAASSSGRAFESVPPLRLGSL
jgi:hypothetical protein